jgi:hypothetical protein
MRRVTNEVLDWLHDKYGAGDGSVWMYKHPKIYFANGRDHLMFLLRWADE